MENISVSLVSKAEIGLTYNVISINKLLNARKLHYSYSMRPTFMLCAINEIHQLSSITSSFYTSIFGASLPLFVITRFPSFLSIFDSDPPCAFGFEFINRTISLCFIWFNRNSFSFSSRINFFRYNSCFSSFLSLSRARILSFPSFSTSSR